MIGIIEPSSSSRNIGVKFDSFMSMEKHVTLMCKSAFYHLRNLSKIRKYLTRESVETLVHAFVASRIDHCKALFSV